uniref:Amine oxidase domain-containing protein n=1 Tax=Minutocellus polymorphus TaxID=265543 RepID=A0A7S0AGM7_9STRA|mmetsp:Transcript_13256/g.22062  ORF Transcript_13256/g.22062 Transcript_13256/m.22062 type:complete len:598 (+) Transcript_13256:139-1932(+)
MTRMINSASLLLALVLFGGQHSSAFTSISTRCERTKLTMTTSSSALAATSASSSPIDDSTTSITEPAKKKVVIIGAGWGGLSAAHSLSSQNDEALDICVVDAAPRVGGLVRDGFQTMSGKRKAEAGQHGLWQNYYNIFHLLEKELPNVEMDEILTDFAEQGQYSPKGLEAVWPVYQRNQKLPTGLAQALYTKFENLPALDRASAAPLVLAFSDFDDSPEAWETYDQISFRDLCMRLGVSKRCYDEAFEPMILTGLFAPGSECSAAAALGMAYFFVLKSQESFDVRWSIGNIGDTIFQPWVEYMESDREAEDKQKVRFLTSTRVTAFEQRDGNTSSAVDDISAVICTDKSGEEIKLEADAVVFATGGAALNSMVRNSSILSRKAEFRQYANLRGTGVLATRIYLDRKIKTPYSANACWGFDAGVGMTLFDITKLHGIEDKEKGTILEVDFYHASSLLVMDDESIVEKVKKDIDTILGPQCRDAKILDAAIVRLPQAVNWYSPGSYKNMPDVESEAYGNAFYAGDIVRTRHGSWSQEKAYVTGIEAANAILGRKANENIIPLPKDEIHVKAGRSAVSTLKKFMGFGDPSKAPSLVDFLW